MPRAPCTFKQTDVTRAIKAVLAAGIEVQRVEVDQDGKIAIITGKAEESSVAQRRLGLTFGHVQALMHGVAPQMCVEQAGPLLGRGAGGRSPGYFCCTPMALVVPGRS
jgi:hypothetical protein